MSGYTHLLAAIEFHEDGKRVLQCAHGLATCFGARLSVLHVVEYLPLDPAGDLISSLPMESSSDRADIARERLLGWCEELGIPGCDLHTQLGSIAGEIVQQAQQLHADLIVIGHRSRRGLSSLFSHIEEGVVHRACCDVLVTHLGT